MAVDNGTGASVTFGTSSFTANITAINGEAIERPAIDTTHLGTTTARTFIPGDLVDHGTLTLEIQFAPDDSPPIKLAAETITVTFPLSAGGATAANWAFSGFATSFSYGVPLEELMTGSLTLKVTGDITATDEVAA